MALSVLYAPPANQIYLQGRTITMNLASFLESKNIVLDVESQGHLDSIMEVMQKIPQNGRLRNREKATGDLLEREKLSSTGIGGGFAVPHVFTEEANMPTLVFARSKKGIEFESIDGRPVHLVLIAFSHPRKKTFFIQCLYHIVRLLKDETVYKQLMDAENSEEIIKILETRAEKPPIELFKPVRPERKNGNGNGRAALEQDSVSRPGVLVGRFLEQAVKGVTA